MARTSSRVLSPRPPRIARAPTLDLAVRLLFSIDEVAHAIDCSDRYVRILIAAGHLKAIRLGRRCLIPKESLEALVRNGAPSVRGNST